MSDWPAGGTVQAVTHESTRLVIHVDTPFDEFQRRFEESMPSARAADIFTDAESWEDARARVKAIAPFGLILYVKGPVGDAFALAGFNVRCAYYIVGNFSEADVLFARDPSVFQFVPIHVFLREAEGGGSTLYFDSLSSVVSVFDDPEMTRAAWDIDAHFAALLESLGAPVPEQLRH